MTAGFDPTTISTTAVDMLRHLIRIPAKGHVS